MYRKWYPPSRYVCYPLYRLLRRRLRVPSAMAYLTVWIVSGGLHGALLAVFGHPAVATAFILGFAGLGLVGAGAICIRSRRNRQRAARPQRCDARKPTAESARR